ncbi:AraC-type DNA-binding protein [Paenibacillus sp. UNCCL117]|uniref:AraC family transcriptional regulator n=1 Tax=unclassified Paenibacillus TaxID=185978 RepID=UPI00088A4820|nr:MULTISPECIES: AraC family transcriptional regulator [unclassified Paenibacillus]SDD02463.1 AraC-type DNA-binding protein [Paenibacillus sp. cl123]SFW32481.1 AraC-type DNA-binding protein [Paenibacillus sp. UNCCL117]
MSAAKEFLHQFYPNIINVLHRDAAFWENSGFRVTRSRTTLNNMAFIYAGEGRLELDGKGFELGPGRLFHLSPGMSMAIASSREHPLLYYGVHFHQLRIQWEGTECQTSLSETPLPFPRVLALPGTSFHEQAASMHAAWQSKEAGYDWTVKLALLRLLDALCDAAAAVPSVVPPIAARQVEGVVQYIQEHYGKPLDRDILAGQASMSVSHFAALFKSVVGISPQRYVEKVRMDHAKSLLAGTVKPISQIAAEVGYSDPLYFTRVFTKTTGMSPRDYRGA